MASSHEKGVLNFLAEFSKLNTMVDGFGITYNPPERLRLSNLQDSLSQATMLITEFNMAFSAYKNATSVRAAAFETLPGLITRVVNFFSITSADSALKVNVKSVAAKLHPASKKQKSAKAATATITMDDAETPKTRSTAQTGYDNKLGHLRLIIALITPVTTYAPAETELTVASLNSFASELEHCNQLVIETQSRLAAIRKQRDELFFGKTTSIIVLGREVKKYVKAAYGANSKEAKAIITIRFT